MSTNPTTIDEAPPIRIRPSTTLLNNDGAFEKFASSQDNPFKYIHGLNGVNQSANYLFVNVLLAIALVATASAACFRIITFIHNNQRRDSMIDLPREHREWKKNKYPEWAWLKSHIFYAPLFTSRHNRKLSFCGIPNIGTLPTRIQSILITTYFGANILYCFSISKGPEAKKYAEFRGRCGALAAFNMILTVLFALRNNPFIWVLHVKYDTLNVFHRWIARLVFLEAFAHVFAFLYNAYQVTYDGQRQLRNVAWMVISSPSYVGGSAAFIAFGILTLHSIGPVRHACYETFLTMHRVSVFVAVAGIYFHLARHTLPQLPWLHLIGAFLLVEYLGRVMRIIYCNFSFRRCAWTTAVLEPLPDDVTRVTFLLPKALTPRPGAYIHAYLPGISLWQSHPFSIAWSQSLSDTNIRPRKTHSTGASLEAQPGVCTVSCLVRAKAGMTRTLYNEALAERSMGQRIYGAVEGPYGVNSSFDSYGTVVLFAAGVGITHQLLFVQQLLIGYNRNTVATQKILLVWCIRHISAIEWVEPWLGELMALPNFRDIVRIRLYLSTTSVSSNLNKHISTTLDIRAERCNPKSVVDEEALSQVGAMVVAVCGSGGFSDSVRAAVRRRLMTQSIDFKEEAFSY